VSASSPTSRLLRSPACPPSTRSSAIDRWESTGFTSVRAPRATSKVRTSDGGGRAPVGMKPGQDTDADGLFTVETIACLGCCTLAPVVQIDHVTYGRLTPQRVPHILRDFLRSQRSVKRRPVFSNQNAHSPAGEIRIGLGSCCVAQGSREVFDEVSYLLSRRGSRPGSSGWLCRHVSPDAAHGTGRAERQLEPLLPCSTRGCAAHRPATFPATGACAAATVFHVASSRPVLYGRRRRQGGASHRCQTIHPREAPVCHFLGPQKRVATEFCGNMDPLDLDEYMRHEGFVSLKRCLTELDPVRIVEQVRISGLRGRGGAGFPTHIKWSWCATRATAPSTSSATATRGIPAPSWIA